MEYYQERIIESVAVLLLYLITRFIIFKVINKTLKNRTLINVRGQVIKQVINIVLVAISCISMFLVWGVEQSQLFVFLGSTLTIIGVAFFAQWSLLSNITSSIIMFFNHPVRINDTITIMEGKDYEIVGKIMRIGVFFVTIEIPDRKEIITLPNNIFIQKIVRKKK